MSSAFCEMETLMREIDAKIKQVEEGMGIPKTLQLKAGGIRVLFKEEAQELQDGINELQRREQARGQLEEAVGIVSSSVESTNRGLQCCVNCLRLKGAAIPEAPGMEPFFLQPQPRRRHTLQPQFFGTPRGGAGMLEEFQTPEEVGLLEEKANGGCRSVWQSASARSAEERAVQQMSLEAPSALRLGLEERRSCSSTMNMNGSKCIYKARDSLGNSDGTTRCVGETKGRKDEGEQDRLGSEERSVAGMEKREDGASQGAKEQRGWEEGKRGKGACVVEEVSEMEFGALPWRLRRSLTVEELNRKIELLNRAIADEQRQNGEIGKADEEKGEEGQAGAEEERRSVSFTSDELLEIFESGTKGKTIVMALTALQLLKGFSSGGVVRYSPC
ncbi:uncharacterized protein MONOS_12305 [Monocercomonoides exilis]|uniref:uncharacterized protein n=1 Tax=Monocercomonoides exilis TaxID=2049356 RepID=UPI00355A1052|nr:hypothetical protein MONOS_12305 [Monocercomonoides exilis]|eukprot:MONOS_12305.1-p1 / transcript=MONOS_12305.1 / gene=MONOS_12305 / organism=Monocercomonoides_exilis_PA203 / gene_product=unspecified product / transcript_product=unspecified product / location=Mono_scaffold00673:12177-13720(+) / protein_length=388 / sequence_SO=supercontig / SO=protein_coding / is_pseudo=false